MNYTKLQKLIKSYRSHAYEPVKIVSNQTLNVSAHILQQRIDFIEQSINVIDHIKEELLGYITGTTVRIDTAADCVDIKLSGDEYMPLFETIYHTAKKILTSTDNVGNVIINNKSANIGNKPYIYIYFTNKVDVKILSVNSAFLTDFDKFINHSAYIISGRIDGSGYINIKEYGNIYCGFNIVNENCFKK